MRCSEQIDKIAEALAKAQGKIKNPEKNRTARIPTKSGKEYSYNYADLPACLDAAKSELAENGISYPSTVEFRDKGPFLVIRLIHTSGQWFESEFRLSGGSEKEFAASMTYGLRYLFCALVGISGEEDIDAGGDEDAEEPPKFGPRGGTNPMVTPKPDAKIGPDHMEKLRALAGKNHWTGRDTITFVQGQLQTPKVEDLTIEKWAKLMNHIETFPNPAPQAPGSQNPPQQAKGA